MRQKKEPLPTAKEASEETEKRLRLIKLIRPEFKEFCEIMIVVGSVAFGQYYSVRKSSDIDILLFLKRKDAKKIESCSLIKMIPKYKEALNYFLIGEVDHFSIIEITDGVEMQYHFWDKEAHFKAETESFIPKVYNIWRTEGKPTIYGLDFDGWPHETMIPVKKCKYGVIHDYPARITIDKKMILLQPILNLISDPMIIFCKDKDFYANLEKIWKNIAREFVKEKANYDKENPIKFIPANWSFNEKSRIKIRKRFEQALIKQGMQI